MYNIILREEKLVGDLETWNFLFLLLLLHFSFVKSTERVYRFQFSWFYVIFFFMDKGRKKLVLLMSRLTDWF